MVNLRVSSIEVRAAQPKAADLRKIRHINGVKGTSNPNVLYIVKLYMDEAEPLYTSLGVRLFVGASELDEYAGFRNGIYFKIYDPDFLTKNAGEKVQFTVDGLGFVDSGVRFPHFSVDTRSEPNGLPSEEQVLSE